MIGAVEWPLAAERRESGGFFLAVEPWVAP